MDNLTTPQRFELEKMRRASEQMSKEQAQQLLLQATRLLMVKTNVYQALLQQSQSACQSTPLPRD